MDSSNLRCPFVGNVSIQGYHGVDFFLQLLISDVGRILLLRLSSYVAGLREDSTGANRENDLHLGLVGFGPGVENGPRHTFLMS